MFLTRRYYSVFLLMVLAAWLVAGCGRIQAGQPDTTAEINLSLAVEPEQPAIGPAELLITVTDAAGQPINNATLDIEGNMTHAGMVPVFAQAEAGEVGRYRVPFVWTMGGDWQVTVTATLPDGRTTSAQFPVTVQ